MSTSTLGTLKLSAARKPRVVPDLIKRRSKPWWWTGERGETLLSILYGSKTLEISKGKPAIEVASAGDLVSELDMVVRGVQGGELDAQMEAASTRLRDGFTGKGK